MDRVKSVVVENGLECVDLYNAYYLYVHDYSDTYRMDTEELFYVDETLPLPLPPLPPLPLTLSLNFLLIDRMNHYFLDSLRLVESMTFTPIITHGVVKYIASMIEAQGSDRDPNTCKIADSTSCVLIPNVHCTICTTSDESTLL